MRARAAEGRLHRRVRYKRRGAACDGAKSVRARRILKHTLTAGCAAGNGFVVVHDVWPRVGPVRGHKAHVRDDSMDVVCGPVRSVHGGETRWPDPGRLTVSV